MSLSCTKIVVLLVALSHYSSYFNKKCIDFSLNNQKLLAKTANPLTFAQEIENFKSLLQKNGASVPKTNYFYVYRYKNERCALYLMNLIAIKELTPQIIPKIEASFLLLITALTKMNIYKEINFIPSSFMFEPSSKRIVFTDMNEILDSYNFKGEEAKYENTMMEKLRKALDMLKDANRAQRNYSYYPDLKLPQVKNNLRDGGNYQELTFMDDDFERQYSQAYPTHRNRIRKNVQNLPVITDPKASTLKINKAKTNNILTISASIDGNPNKQIEIASNLIMENLYLCNFYEDRYKECQLIEDKKFNSKGDLELKIKKGYQIEVAVDSQEVGSYPSSKQNTKNISLNTYEVFLILVPARTKDIVSSKFVINNMTSNKDTKKVFFHINEKNILIATEMRSDGTGRSQREVFSVSGIVTLPNKLEFVQTLPELYLTSDEYSSNLRTDLFYVEVPNNYIITSLEKNKLHLIDQEFPTTYKFFSFCKNPDSNLQVGGKGKSKIINFMGKKMTYPKPVELMTITSRHVCLGGNTKDGIFFTLEADSKEKFEWQFNSYNPIERMNKLTNIVYLSVGLIKYNFDVSMEKFDYPKQNTDTILVSIRVNEDDEPYAKVYSLKNSGELYSIYSAENTDASNKISNLETTNRPVLKRKNEFKFENIPRKLTISKDGKDWMNLSLEGTDVTYLSEQEVVYSIYQPALKGCNLYISKQLNTKSNVQGDTIAIDCVDIGTAGAGGYQQSHQKVADLVDISKATSGISTVVTQARGLKQSKLNRIIL